MKTLIVLYSYHHKNTLKVAEAMSKVLDCEIVNADETDADILDEYDVVGFGAGIDSGMHYKELLDFAQSIKPDKSKKCFIFSTSAVQGERKVFKDHLALRKILNLKGYKNLGEFSCKGFNTNLFLKYFGGMNKANPDKDDINNAVEFAKNILALG